jgi:hypothetical protein
VQVQAGSSLETPRTAFPSVVFVHDSWNTRVGARLDAGGMRMDSIQAALSHSGPCEVQRFLDTREAVESGDTDAPIPALRFGSAAGQETVDPRAGGQAEEGFAAECMLQYASDAFGVVALPGLLWQGDLPGLRARGAMFVRDMGPERNARLLARFPGRRALALMPPSPFTGMREPVLVSYERATSLLWGVEPNGGRDAEASR